MKHWRIDRKSSMDHGVSQRKDEESMGRVRSMVVTSHKNRRMHQTQSNFMNVRQQNR